MNNKDKILQLFNQIEISSEVISAPRMFNGRKIIIYGAGGGFHWIQEVLMNLYGYMPVAVLDRNFSCGDTYQGIPAFSPLDYQPSDDEKQNALVIICVGKQEYHAEIIHTLRGMGFKHVILLMDLYEIHNPFGLPEELEERGFSYYRERKEQILDCLDLFEDDLSREIYTRFLQTHMTRKPVPLPSSLPGEQYTPSDIQLKQGYSRYIYCGVSSGEMARVLHDIGGVDDIVCFEPNAHQFKKLVDFFQDDKGQAARRVYAYPCAVYSREANMPFIYTDDSFGNRISENGQVLVPCVSIDHVIPGFNPTFISLDIEGAELEALKGAEKTLKDSRPDLAVCVYHSINHLWETPLYLHGLDLGYRFYLRNYTTFTAETVLYASI